MGTCPQELQERRSSGAKGAPKGQNDVDRRQDAYVPLPNTCPQKMLQPQRKMHQPTIERMHFSVLHFSEICYNAGTLRRLRCGRAEV